jgi:type IV pilus assembly protein PilN
MRLDINLASHPYEDARRFWFRWGGALVALGIISIWLIYYTGVAWLDARKEHQLAGKYEQQIAARDQQKANAQALMNLPQNVSTRDRSQFLNDLFYRKAFSWTRVFEDLEQVMPSGLHVVSIAPALADNNELAIKLVVAGTSHDHALELVRRMEDSQHFQQTRIESENAEQGSGANAGDTIKVDISALYVPAGQTQSRNGGEP